MTVDEERAMKREKQREYRARNPLSEEQKQKARERSKLYHKNNPPSATQKEKRSLYLKNRAEAFTSDQKEKALESQRRYRQRNPLSEEQKILISEYQKNRNANLSDEQKAKKLERQRERFLNLTEDKKNKEKCRKVELGRFYRKNLSDEKKEKILQYHKDYKKLNPQVWARANIKRLYKKALRVSKAESDNADDLIRKFKSKIINWCSYCDCCIKDGKIEIDHILPLSGGGLHRSDNLCVSCVSCNRKKSNKILGIDWFPPNGKYGDSWAL